MSLLPVVSRSQATTRYPDGSTTTPFTGGGGTPWRRDDDGPDPGSPREEAGEERPEPADSLPEAGDIANEIYFARGAVRWDPWDRGGAAHSGSIAEIKSDSAKDQINPADLVPVVCV
jgi:hypothetical protein